MCSTRPLWCVCMRDAPSDPLLVLVTGLPGTGKSTMADVAAVAFGAPVLGHDWAMSGLRPYPELQTALDAMGLRGHRGVGWSILSALARSQLRHGRPVVLDGVARATRGRGMPRARPGGRCTQLRRHDAVFGSGVAPQPHRGPTARDSRLVRARLGARGARSGRLGSTGRRRRRRRGGGNRRAERGVVTERVVRLAPWGRRLTGVVLVELRAVVLHDLRGPGRCLPIATQRE